MNNKLVGLMFGINILAILLFSYMFFLNKNPYITIPNQTSSLEKQIIDGASENMNVVVQIIAEEKSTYYQENIDGKNTFLEKQTILNKGSGIIISKKGYIITNKHVIDNLDLKYSIVLNDDTVIKVKKIRKDDFIDIAILFVESVENIQVEARFIDIDSNISIGQFVFAIGNPLSEYPNTLTFGIISGKGRKLVIEDKSKPYYAGLYQTDVALNPGNSGGPLINLSGEVIGIITAISRGGNNVGFALPLNRSFIDKTIDIIEENGDLLRPYLGISYIDTNTGAIIDTIFSGSPLQGQLFVGDIITALDKRNISFNTPLLYYLYNYKINDTVVFNVLRNGKILSLPIILGQKTL